VCVCLCACMRVRVCVCVCMSEACIYRISSLLLIGSSTGLLVHPQTSCVCVCVCVYGSPVDMHTG
jgi:hypothetical protein